MSRNILLSVWSVVCSACMIASAQTPTPLKDAFKGDFYVGAAMSARQITGADQRGDKLLETHFNAISPENALKWEVVHPQPDKYNFSLADQYVEFGQKHHMFIVGHTLVWHSQTPSWVFHDDKGNLLSRDALLARMHDHIQMVVGRYKGKVNSWDVVNEALSEDGTMRPSLWLKIIGDDYIEKAFQYAHEADPQAKLTYNDYNLENAAKLRGAIGLIKSLQAKGVTISSVGLQDHVKMDWPTVQQEDTAISELAALGVKVAITELDVDVLPATGRQPTADVSLRIEQNAALNPYVNGLPDSVQQELAKRYADLFGVYLKHKDAVMRVTFWGVTDADSWLNNWPVRGRTSYPLLFDRNGAAKLAFDAIVRLASETPEH